MTRRRASLESLVAEHDLDALVLYGADRAGGAVTWLTGWPVTVEAAVVVRPGEADIMYLQYYNHLPNARRIAADADVRWGGTSTVAGVCETLNEFGAAAVGVVGPVRHGGFRLISEAVRRVVPLDGAYQQLRLVKSPEELEWLRRGAELSDLAVEKLAAEARVGMDEYRLGAIIESAFLPEGGVNQIHYVGVTPMESPDLCVPAQWPSTRQLRRGDVLVCEISASWWGYPGQVLRTMTFGSDPTELYAELHRVAAAAYEAILGVVGPGVPADALVEAGSIIEDAGFAIYDDLVHGYGGGYLPPVLRLGEPAPEMTLEAGMTLVIQPNVITRDERAGVQTGGLVLVTDQGAEPLQRARPGLWVID